MNQKMDRRATFDYILIGTGPAGAVIARKLSDDKKTSVLVLEAGDNNSRERPIRDSLFAPPFILTDETFFRNIFGRVRVCRRQMQQAGHLNGPGAGLWEAVLPLTIISM